jgi:hypothetical protein
VERQRRLIPALLEPFKFQSQHDQIVARGNGLCIDKRCRKCKRSRQTDRRVQGGEQPLANRNTSVAHAAEDFEIRSRRFPSLEARAMWLFEFLRLDLKALSTERAMDIREGAWEFATIGGAFVKPRTGLAADHKPTRAVIRMVQGEVRNGIKRVRANDIWVMRKPGRYGIARWGPVVIGGLQSGSFRSLFVQAAMEIVKAEWHRLYSCPSCTHLFLKLGKQAYCSPPCSQRARWKRFKKHRKSRDYHAERVRAARKRFGPNVRVGRKRL